MGDGPERQDLQAQAQRLGLGERIIFAGELDHAHVVDALYACDLFVFPSQTETLGLAVLEAMAAGRVVVAVQGGAMPDIVRDGETGRVVPPDPEALRRAIADLLAAPGQRQAWGARAQAAAAAYRQDRVLEQVLGVYDALLESRHAVVRPAP